MFDQVVDLLKSAGISIRNSERGYRPSISLANYTAKILKPRNVISMLDAGSRDLGFAGADWIHETGTELVELFDTGLNPVRLIVAAPHQILEDGKLPKRKITVASEYPNLAQRWIDDNKLDAEVLQTFGATEVFPPEDADCIMDNTSTGSTLRANGLEIIDQVMTSSTRLYASKAAMRACDDGPQCGSRKFGGRLQVSSLNANTDSFTAQRFGLGCGSGCGLKKRTCGNHSEIEKCWSSRHRHHFGRTTCALMLS